METAARLVEREALAEAFRLFEQASASLRAEYSGLRSEAARLREEAEEKNLFLREILERIPDGIVVIDPSDALIACNENARRLMDLRRPPPAGTLLSSLGPVGRRIAELGDSSAATTTVEGSQGDALRLRVTRTPLRESGAARGALLVIEDLTDSHLVREESERARRLASMGEMAARIAHEIRNPLTSCRLYLEMASQDARAARREELLENLAKIETVLGSIECSMSNMLGFLRSHRPGRRIPFDPLRLAQECLDHVRPLLNERGIEAAVDSRVDGRPVVSDPSLLRQVFLNILLNAVQAVDRGSGGRLAVGISPRSLRRHASEEPFLRFSFRDSGTGIPEHILPRIFDPFFTTKDRGTGLGLTVVQSIVASLDGFVEVQSAPGAGTTFSILIPHPAVSEGEDP